MIVASRAAILLSLCVSLPNCGAVRAIMPGGGAGNAAPEISVMRRGAGGTEALARCLETDAPVEIVVDLNDPNGLARVEIGFTGVISDASLVVSPGGDDARISEAGVPGSEQIVVTFTPAVPGQFRVASTISFETAAPNTGQLTVFAQNQSGAGGSSGAFDLVAPGGC